MKDALPCTALAAELKPPDVAEQVAVGALTRGLPVVAMKPAGDATAHAGHDPATEAIDTAAM